MTTKLGKARRRSAALPVDEIDFTPREIEVLDLMTTGMSYKLIADKLHVSAHTAKFHVANAIWKLGAANGTHAAVMWALHRAGKRTELRTEHCDQCARLFELAAKIVETAPPRPTA